MKKYTLIKEYPGSPKLGIICTDPNLESISNFPEFWKEIEELIKPIGTKFTAPNSNHIFEINKVEDDNVFIIWGDDYNLGNTYYTIKQVNDYFKNNTWEEYIEQDYEILSFISDKRILKCQEKSEYKFFYFIDQNDFNVKPCIGRTEKELLESNLYNIHSVKRLSDGEIFNVDDLVENSQNPLFRGKINKFEIIDNRIMVFYDGHDWLKDIQKVKKPLFTTKDGVDIFKGDWAYAVGLIEHEHNKIFPVNSSYAFSKNYEWFSTKEKAEEYILFNQKKLSLNDLIECWGVSPKEVKTSNLFKKFKNKVENE